MGRRIRGVVTEAVVAMLLAVVTIAISLPIAPVEAALR
jgi:hypothetical protein